MDYFLDINHLNSQMDWTPEQPAFQSQKHTHKRIGAHQDTWVF